MQVRGTWLGWAGGLQQCIAGQLRRCNIVQLASPRCSFAGAGVYFTTMITEGVSYRFGNHWRACAAPVLRALQCGLGWRVGVLARKLCPAHLYSIAVAAVVLC